MTGQDVARRMLAAACDDCRPTGARLILVGRDDGSVFVDETIAHADSCPRRLTVGGPRAVPTADGARVDVFDDEWQQARAAFITAAEQADPDREDSQQ